MDTPVYSMMGLPFAVIGLWWGKGTPPWNLIYAPAQNNPGQRPRSTIRFLIRQESCMEAINARLDLYKERKKIVFDKECDLCVLIGYLTFTLRASLNVMLR